MSFILSVLNKVQATEAAAKQSQSKTRGALIDQLCDSRGTEYRDLKQYRNL